MIWARSTYRRVGSILVLARRMSKDTLLTQAGLLHARVRHSGFNFPCTLDLHKDRRMPGNIPVPADHPARESRRNAPDGQRDALHLRGNTLAPSCLQGLSKRYAICHVLRPRLLPDSIPHLRLAAAASLHPSPHPENLPCLREAGRKASNFHAASGPSTPSLFLPPFPDFSSNCLPVLRRV